MPAAGVVMIVAVVLIVAGARLLPRVDDRRAAQDHQRASTRRSPASVGIIEKSAPVNEVVTTINANLDAGVDAARGPARQEGRAWRTRSAWSTACTPARPRPASGTSPTATTVKPPRISEVYTKGTLTLARLGREAPIAAASPDGPVLRNAEPRQPRGAALYPDVRQTRPGVAAALAGHRHRLAGAVRAARRHRAPRKRMPGGAGASSDSRPTETDGGVVRPGLAYLRRLEPDNAPPSGAR